MVSSSSRFLRPSSRISRAVSVEYPVTPGGVDPGLVDRAAQRAGHAQSRGVGRDSGRAASSIGRKRLF